MRVPDETKRKKGKKSVLDIPGFNLCTHCLNCPIVSQSQIQYDGFWYCLYFNKWKEGNDILEYRCRGYQMKRCSHCAKKRFCSASRIPSTFCNKFRLKGVDVGSLYGGRVRQILPNASDGSIDTEMAYIDLHIRQFENTYGEKEESSNYTRGRS